VTGVTVTVAQAAKKEPQRAREMKTGKPLKARRKGRGLLFLPDREIRKTAFMESSFSSGMGYCNMGQGKGQYEAPGNSRVNCPASATGFNVEPFPAGGEEDGVDAGSRPDRPGRHSAAGPSVFRSEYRYGGVPIHRY
jgi:hypothetical protein